MSKQANPSFFITTIRLLSVHLDIQMPLEICISLQILPVVVGLFRGRVLSARMSCSLLCSQGRSRVEKIKKDFSSLQSRQGSLGTRIAMWDHTVCSPCNYFWRHSPQAFREILHFLYCDNQVRKIDTRNTDFRLQWKFLSPNTAKTILSCWLHYITEQVAHADAQPLKWLIRDTYCNQLYETRCADQWWKSSV